MKFKRCLYCDKPIDIPLGSKSRRKYCSDNHRKYHWKKKNWEKYLKWQRDYFRDKKRHS